MACTWIMSAFYFTLLCSIFFLSMESVEAQQLRSNKTETDRLALLAFKAKITVDPFDALGSWNDTLDFCKWQGVTCSPRHQRVIILDLMSKGLVGSVPPHIGNLTFLRALHLRNNSFHGEIPLEVGRLYRLQRLALNNNSFVGTIPVNISHCTNLRVLDLGGNMLEGEIPVEIGSLSKLIALILYKNNLTGGIPSFIGNLTSLQSFDLSFNSLGGTIPNFFGKLKSLAFVGLGVNKFSGTVPPSLYNITSLISIVLADNQLTGSFLPPNTRLPNLENFLIGGNQFSGTLPVSLFNMSRLQMLDMSVNNFSGQVPLGVGNLKELRIFNLGKNRLGSGKTDDLDFLTTLTNCTILEMFNIADNQFGGVLPESVSNLSNHLYGLYMGGNQINGIIPSGIQNYLKLTVLGMQDNFFTGSIPFGIGKLQNLRALGLNRNRLSGKLPSSLGNLSHLYNLDLSNNNLEGNIISDITKCQFLQLLNLSNNNLIGTIPEDVTVLSSNLLSLDLAHNSLTGSLPTQLDKFQNLQLLDVSENKLSAEIPSTIGGCSSLQVLSLKGNFFRGPIPTSLKSLSEISTLDLSLNNLSGVIPNILGSLPSLQTLNLSFNNLEGEVPTEGAFRNVSGLSILGNHKLCGGISKLQLPACPIPRPNKGSKSSVLKVTLGVVISSIVVAFCFIVAIYWRRKPKVKPTQASIPGAPFERVSYRELHQGTDGFSLANLIGVGSFGSVYRGILLKYGQVAVKVFNLIERGASKSFITECDALRKIRHRNLLKILTVCSSVDSKGNDFKALVLKFMPNGSLEEWLHPSSDRQYPIRVLSLLKRLNIAIDIASALDYLHNDCEAPIVHCDLKPSNILLDEDMVAYVSDFGLTKFLPESSSNFNTSESSSTSPKGTIGYIPPEYGTGVHVCTQGDVYSYGILLLEMFTGKRPTDEIFKDGLTLHDFSFMALPSRVMDIVDPQIFSEDDHDGAIINSAHRRDMKERLQECVISIIRIGVACSIESQSDRIGINDALMKLHVIKEVFLGTREAHSTI